MAASRDTTNLKKVEELPHYGKGVYKWQIRFSYVDPLRGGNSYIKKVHYIGTLTQAQAERDHLRMYLRQGLDPDDYDRPHEDARDSIRSQTPTGQNLRSRAPKPDPAANPTFRDLFPRYQADRLTQDLRGSTITTENRVIEDRILPYIGKWCVNAVNVKDFQGVRSRIYRDHIEQAKEPLSPATLNKWLRIMKGYVGWCCSQMGLPHHARDLKAYPKPKKKRGTALTSEQADLLLAHLKEIDSPHYPLLYIALYTGQRWSTLSALRWEDLDEANDTLWFRRSQYHGEVSEGSKTGHIASAPLKPFKAILEAHRAKLEESNPEGLALGWVWPAEARGEKTLSDLEHSGMCVYNSHINKALKKACSKVGIPSVTMHDLRRSFVSIALAKGISPTVIKGLTGHSEEMVGHYHHQSTDAKAALIGAVMGNDD